MTDQLQNKIDLSQLELQIKQYQSKYEQGKGQLSLLKEQLKETKEELAQVKENLETWEKVKLLFAETSEFAREQLKTKIERTVTAALQSIIDDSDLRFKVEVDKKGGNPVAEWKVVSKYNGEWVAEPPESARGGGVSDIVSIALRLALIELASPKNEGILNADEPGKHVSSDYAPNLAKFLEEYSEKTGRSILMTTHNRDLAEVASKRYGVSRDENGNSEVNEV
jgi:DNA repair exonuclease SbcCD ATPase subunit